MAASRRQRRYRTKTKDWRLKALGLVLSGFVLLFLFSLYLYDRNHPGFLDGLIPQLRQRVVTANAIQGDTQVHFIDVGQGDSVLLCQNGQYALIDAGNPDAADEVVWYLTTLGVQKLEYIFCTHAHADHIGGVEEVLRHFQVGTVVFPDFAKGPQETSRILENLLRYVELHHVPATTARDGEAYPLGTGTITILMAGTYSEDINDTSTVTLFEAENLRFLNTGDGEKILEDALLQKYGLTGQLHANLLKAGHHGSRTSNTLPFLTGVQPSLMVVSCGKNNSYGHPNEEVLEHAEALHIDVLRTDLEGSIAVAADGQQLIVVTQTQLQKEAA